MTVAELITKLQQLEPTLKVLSFHRDDYVDAVGVIDLGIKLHWDYTTERWEKTAAITID